MTRSQETRLRTLDLFSGIGGFALGLERAGFETAAFCEIDPYCRAVLAKHWPGVPCLDDIRAIDASRLGGLGRIDLVCGGFPCQPFSHAGKQRAQADDRHLWPEMCRVIALARPAWVLGENVAGIIPLALDDVLADLEGLGYAAKPFAIPAVAVDAKHRRERIWIVARDTNGKSEPARAVDAEMEELRGAIADTSRMQRPTFVGDEQDGVVSSSRPVANTERERQQGSRPSGNAGDPAPRGERQTAQPRNGGVRCLWSPEPDVGRVAHGVPARVDRLRCLGNAVVPQVVEEIGRAILRAAA